MSTFLGKCQEDRIAVGSQIVSLSDFIAKLLILNYKVSTILGKQVTKMCESVNL